AVVQAPGPLGIGQERLAHVPEAQLLAVAERRDGRVLAGALAPPGPQQPGQRLHLRVQRRRGLRAHGGGSQPPGGGGRGQVGVRRVPGAAWTRLPISRPRASRLGASTLAMTSNGPAVTSDSSTPSMAVTAAATSPALPTSVWISTHALSMPAPPRSVVRSGPAATVGPSI